MSTQEWLDVMNIGATLIAVVSALALGAVLLVKQAKIRRMNREAGEWWVAREHELRERAAKKEKA